MKTVSIDRAAEILQVSRRTIYNHIRRGHLRTIRTIGGQSQRVTLESLALVQDAGRRRGERFFVAEHGADATAVGESLVEPRHHPGQHPSSAPAPEALNLSEQSFEFLGRPAVRPAHGVVEAPSQLQALRRHLRDVSKVPRSDLRGGR